MNVVHQLNWGEYQEVDSTASVSGARRQIIQLELCLRTPNQHGLIQSPPVLDADSQSVHVFGCEQLHFARWMLQLVRVLLDVANGWTAGLAAVVGGRGLSTRQRRPVFVKLQY